MAFQTSLHRAICSESLDANSEQADDTPMSEPIEGESEAARSPSSHPPSEQPESEVDDATATRGSPAPSIAPSVDTSISALSSGSKSGKRRQRYGMSSVDLKNPSLYDLVAGKVRLSTGRAPTNGVETTKPFSPAEYYFVRKRVKTGDPDEDERLYWRPEVDKHELPPSDLLWGIHQRASEFYTEQGKGQFKFMDETALLAMGVLLEETMRESLGETGHLAFLEPDEDASQSESEDQDVDDGADSGNDVESSARRPAPPERQPRRVIPKGYTKDDFLTDED